MAPTTDSKINTILEARYTSPKSSKTFAHPLNATSTDLSTEEKTAYLSTLRKTVSMLQEEVNVFLTQAMEQDKAGLAQDGVKVDDKKEEDNYGEEVEEDEET